jgi:hypothetical protein
MSVSSLYLENVFAHSNTSLSLVDGINIILVQTVRVSRVSVKHCALP